MGRKLALKRLTASDLTLFKWHYINRRAGNQKAFNLDASVLVGSLYPLLGEASSVPNPRFPIDLYLLGPGLAGAHNLQRKILRQQKNWRLNGELIDGPDDSPQRYNSLREGDYALFEFIGDAVPSMAKVVLISKQDHNDSAIHVELDSAYGRGSMWLLSEEDVALILERAQVQQSHPLREWVESGALEDAALGGSAGAAQLNKRRGGRGISPEDFQLSIQLAAQTGVSGEELVNTYLEREVSNGNLLSFEWVASVNAVSPYDFRIALPGGDERLVEVKSTVGAFSNPVHISWNELLTAVDAGRPYDIMRLYQVTPSSAKMRVARDVASALRGIFDCLRSLPVGVVADSVSLHPDVLPFEEEVIYIQPSDEDFSQGALWT